MRGRDKYCITTSGTIDQQWEQIRDVLGPTPANIPSLTGVSGLREIDKAAYYDWEAIPQNNGKPFDKWLIWKIRVGTDRHGNLPADKKLDGKVGHCWAPCPYSTQSSDLRTRHLLGLDSSDPLPSKTDHSSGGTTYFMQNIVRGSRWGYECTYPACNYYIDNGKKYFYV